MQERQEELESNNKRLQQEEQDFREKYHEVWILTCNSLQPRTKPVDTHYKILIFCTRPPKKSPQIESPFHASPIPMLFAVTPEMHTWAFRPKQLWTRIGGGGGDFVPVRNDCSMARNYETHGNVQWALSGVVECVVRHSKISGRSRGGAPGAWSSLFLDETEAQRAE